MVTSKPIGSISYNTPIYLYNLLDSLFYDGIIEDYRVIRHFAESSDKKDHFHLMVFPASRLDTVSFRNRFVEPCPFDLPLGCMPFRYSEPLNWLMYVLHDPDFIASHPKENDGDGKELYQLSDIRTPFSDLLERDFVRACSSVRVNTNQMIMQKAAEGKRFMEILAEVPTANPVSLNAILAGLYRDLHESSMGQELVSVVSNEKRNK